ncbi:unannotated protein [freshwater metagenome]|uniref:Unannotated protein n=1 Tax=freshwater metagenome TaxID=449393 RepID=A0A6J7VGJ3_9ZZZZ
MTVNTGDLHFGTTSFLRCLVSTESAGIPTGPNAINLALGVLGEEVLNGLLRKASGICWIALYIFNDLVASCFEKLLGFGAANLYWLESVEDDHRDVSWLANGIHHRLSACATKESVVRSDVDEDWILSATGIETEDWNVGCLCSGQTFAELFRSSEGEHDGIDLL